MSESSRDANLSMHGGGICMIQQRQIRHVGCTRPQEETRRPTSQHDVVSKPVGRIYRSRRSTFLLCSLGDIDGLNRYRVIPRLFTADIAVVLCTTVLAPAAGSVVLILVDLQFIQSHLGKGF